MTESTNPIATPRVASGALFLDDAGRVLLLHTTYKDHWEIPGGYVEPGESPLQACRREVAEELGITPPIGAHLVVDWAPADNEGDKILFIFDGGTITEETMRTAQLDVREVDRWAFVPTDQLDSYVPPRLTRRLRTAIAARQDGRATYAEHGTVAAER